jgi:acid phosphatase class B
MKEQTVIVDLDGTISQKGERGWYEYSKVSGDIPVERIIRLVRMLHLNGMNIVFCTGREETCMKQSVEWIRRHVFMNDVEPVEIYMRPTKDNRPDFVVKKEIYRNLIEPKHNVWFVLDDRNSVVKMWREIGLTCLQVEEGNY